MEAESYLKPVWKANVGPSTIAGEGASPPFAKKRKDGQLRGLW